MLLQGPQFFSETMRKSFAQGEAKALLRVLDRRLLTVSDDQRERILTCTDIATLEGWLDKAVTASSADELFAE
jgi:hypothetical protein